MKLVGIICEYNPLHNGHKKQIDRIRTLMGEECAIVCLMSGNFVQRGEPAIFRKDIRAKAAVLSGADLVLELPVTYALSSAEGFAAGGVRILGSFCDYLCFGCETPDSELLTSAAHALLSAEYPPLLRSALATGCSFPAARQKALEAMGIDAAFLSSPNNILAVEYCKAILSSGSSMKPLPIQREGDYHTDVPDAANPSATSLRHLMYSMDTAAQYIPAPAYDCFRAAEIHWLEAGERAVLARLRTMRDAEFVSLPYGSEGLWRKFMHASHTCTSLSGILEQTKSKRYTYTRLQRMLMCAFLGIDQSAMDSPAPYARALAFNDAGRSVLKKAQQMFPILNIGSAADHPYWELEQRCADLYGLFAKSQPEPAGTEQMLRVFYHASQAGRP